MAVYFMSENLQLQEDEIGALLAIFDDDGVKVSVCEHASESSGKLAKVNARIFSRAVRGEFIDVGLELPHEYPSSACPHVSVSGSSAKNFTKKWCKTLGNFLFERSALLIGSESCFEIISCGVEKVSEAVSLSGEEEACTPKTQPAYVAVSSVVESPIEAATLGRRCIYFHHIIADSKRSAVIETAIALGLRGISKIGWPGVVVCEGFEKDCIEYVRSLRRLSWKHMVVRGEQQIRVNPEELESCLKFQAGFTETSDMSEIASTCKEVGLYDLFLTSMKIYKERVPAAQRKTKKNKKVSKGKIDRKKNT